jgi:hypothetical protein
MMLALEGEAAFHDRIHQAAQLAPAQEFLRALHRAGIRQVRCRPDDVFDFAVDRAAATGDIRCPGGTPCCQSGFVSGLRGLVRAVGGPAPLAAGFDSLSWHESLAQGMTERRVPMCEPVYGERALFSLVADFALTQGRLAHVLERFKGAPVEQREIFGCHFGVIQRGVHQIVIAARAWVAWQSEPIRTAFLVAAAPPGHRTRTGRGARIVIDEIVRREAAHLAENHQYSPDLYDAPLDSGYGEFGVGALDRAFVMPFKSGFYELSPAIEYDARRVPRRTYRLNAAWKVARADGAGPDYLPVPIASRHWEAIDRATVAAVVKHWARSHVATGQGLVDDELSMLAGDQNIEATVSADSAAVPDVVSAWRIAARGRLVADVDRFVAHLMAPVEPAPIENAPGELAPIYLAGDPGDPARRRAIVWRGVTEGLEQSDLPARARTRLESALRQGLSR